jgi:tellurite methyltransferase
MQQDRERWNLLHTKGHNGLDPSTFLAALLPYLPGGTGPSGAERFRALDVACGKGADALLLARVGYKVDAVDISSVALRIVQERASLEGLEDLIETQEIDLSDAQFPEESYDLIFCRRFLDRELLPQLRRAVKPGGAMVLELFLEEQARYPSGPKCPAYLLRCGEIKEILPEKEFEILRWYEEGGSLLGCCLAGIAGVRRKK